MRATRGERKARTHVEGQRWRAGPRTRSSLLWCERCQQPTGSLISLPIRNVERRMCGICSRAISKLRQLLAPSNASTLSPWSSLSTTQARLPERLLHCDLDCRAPIIMANLPPTPAPSTEIAGKPGAIIAHLESISLPPAAIASARSSVSSSSTSAANSDSSYRPISPTSPEARFAPNKTPAKPTSHPRKRSSAAADLANADDDYALPPPPTRSRKIIQMKPQSNKVKPQEQSQAPPTISQPPAKGAPASTATTAPTTSKKKQANASTAAGRKIARKTAHSLIERRRRSKMNEEFGVLKDMIPACSGQDMHKLAILQVRSSSLLIEPSC